jgi:hypothetical protein
MAFSEKQNSFRQYDVFNGDADGICGLHQYRLANPAPDSTLLVTGVKRDIKLLDHIRDVEASRIAVFDVSMDSNRDALQQLLAADNEIVYIDHHFSGAIPDAPNLSHHIDPTPDTCTSLIVDRLLGGRFTTWAICGAFGDNLYSVATAAASELSMKEADTVKLREIGELLNYNGYGASLQDLYFNPDGLYHEVREYEDPLDFYEQSPVLGTLRLGFENDMNQALAQPVFDETRNNRIYRFPDSPWARRVMGEFANLKARENPAGAHALITENNDGTLRISVRAPLDNRLHADMLCRSFPTGGGRSAAAGINALPTEQLGSFTKLFNETYT